MYLQNENGSRGGPAAQQAHFATRRRAHAWAARTCTSIPALLNTCPVIQTARGGPRNAAPPAAACQNEHTHRRVHLIYKAPPDTHSKHKPHVGRRARPPRADQHNNACRQRRASTRVRAHPARHMLPSALSVSTGCVPASLVAHGSVHTSGQPHIDGGAALRVGTAPVRCPAPPCWQCQRPGLGGALGESWGCPAPWCGRCGRDHPSLG